MRIDAMLATKRSEFFLFECRVSRYYNHGYEYPDESLEGERAR